MTSKRVKPKPEGLALGRALSYITLLEALPQEITYLN